MISRTIWSRDDLEADRLRAIAEFRRERVDEPLEAYLDAFEDVQDAVENLLESTVDLSLLEQEAMSILTDKALREALRYLPGPPISVDDLKTLVEAESLAISTVRADPDLVARIVDLILAGLDRRRFPWVSENREPTQAERDAAILATATLIATRRAETSRRTGGKRAQEDLVRESLTQYGLEAVSIPNRTIPTLSRAPQQGQFCQEVTLGKRKADLVIGLWDGRIMPIECKVSNSATNSVKRLNNDAAVKAGVWVYDFGTQQVVPVAVLSGVYKLHNLEDAQNRGLTLYWAHRLNDLTEWIEHTRSS